MHPGGSFSRSKSYIAPRDSFRVRNRLSTLISSLCADAFPLLRRSVTLCACRLGEYEGNHFTDDRVAKPLEKFQQTIELIGVEVSDT